MSVIILNTFDWNLSRISILEFDADPHTCTPYVQISFRIALYTRSLFSSDGCDFRSMIQYSLRSLRYSCFVFVDMCLGQVSFRSRCILRRFTSTVWVSCLLFSWTGGHVFFFKVQVTWTDFVSFGRN